MKGIKFAAILPVALFVLSSGSFAQTRDEPGKTGAAPQAALSPLNLTLYRTKVVTSNVPLNLNFNVNAPAFTKTSIACPATTRTCTLRIDVVSQISQADGSVAYDVLVDGGATDIFPNPSATVSSVAGPGSTTASMTFYKSVQPGSHAVQMRFRRNSGADAAAAGYRAMTLSMYTP